jgi:hypothetical protein
MKRGPHGSARTPEEWQAPRTLHNVASEHGYKVIDQESILALYDHPSNGTLIVHHDGSWHHTSRNGTITEGVGTASLSNHLSKPEK